MLWSSNPALPKWFNMSSQRKICSRSKYGMGSGQGMKWSYSVFWKGKRLSNEEVWHFEKTGQKVSTEQVAKDMRNARTHDDQRRFGREEWLTKLQVQGFFSRLASSRRRQGWHVADTSIKKVTKLESYEVVKNLALNTQLYLMFTIFVNITIATSYHLSMSVC